MLANTTIRCPVSGKILADLVWRRKGSNKKGYLLSGFKIFAYERLIDSLEGEKKMAMYFMLHNLVRATSVKKIRTETDLKLFINAFVDQYANMLFEFNESMVFSYAVKSASTMKEIIKTIKVKGHTHGSTVRQYTNKYLDQKQLRVLREAKLKSW